MKKLVFVLAGLIAITAINAQSLEEIVKNYSASMKYDKLAGISSIKITGKMSAMGMEMPMVMYMKNPNKIKVTYSFNGQDMVSVFDGEKGYMINPMTGSSVPVQLTGDQLKQVNDNNVFRNQLLDYFKKGQLTLEGEENVNDKPAFKLKANAGSSPVIMFLDKGSYMLVKTSTTVNQMGNSMNVDSYMTNYVDINGVLLPKKTTAMANGMEAGVITFDNIEVNIPMEDSIFKIK
jgi:outer membrane lipoprotein-sorting protein